MKFQFNSIQSKSFLNKLFTEFYFSYLRWIECKFDRSYNNSTANMKYLPHFCLYWITNLYYYVAPVSDFLLNIENEKEKLIVTLVPQ